MAATSAGHRFSPHTPDDHAAAIWIVTILCFIYAAITVLTRAHIRWQAHGLDDYLIASATVLHLGEMVAVIVGLKAGVGRTLALLSPDDVSRSSRAVFAAQILYTGAACLAKCSTISLMLKLFNLNGPKWQVHGRTTVYRWVGRGIITAIGIWGVASIIGLSVDCSAANMIRAPALSQCPKQQLRWEIITAVDIATEAAIILLTILIVMPVRLAPFLKFQVILAFLFRLPLVAVSILRMYYVRKYTHASNPGLSQEPILIIQQIYLCWSIISATIPNLQAFVRSFGSGFGISINMDLYGSGYASKNSQRNQYELGSVRRTVRSGKSRSAGINTSRRKTFQEISDSVGRLGSRKGAVNQASVDHDSIESAGSQGQIIPHWSRIADSAAENHAAGWGLAWWDPRRAIKPVVAVWVRVAGSSWLWPNRAADATHEDIIERSYGFLDHIWTKANGRSPSWYLESLAVAPSHQGQGVGRALVKWGLDQAEREGIACSVISADGKENFYQRCGFDVGPVGRSGEGEGNPLDKVPGGLIFFRDARPVAHLTQDLHSIAPDTMAGPGVRSLLLQRTARAFISPTRSYTLAGSTALLHPQRSSLSRFAPAPPTTSSNHHHSIINSTRSFTTSRTLSATLNQIRRSPRKPKKARRPESPAMRGRPEMKGVCLKVGITKPKKPNSGKRPTAKIRLSSGRVVAAYIPGEGHNVQQHSVVMVRGGRRRRAESYSE
ncbi:hypothetical protein DV735_g108, partial [Chaetothyriales sp. CBS 134920]